MFSTKKKVREKNVTWYNLKYNGHQSIISERANDSLRRIQKEKSLVAFVLCKTDHRQCGVDVYTSYIILL